MTSISISITTHGPAQPTAAELWAALPRPRLAAPKRLPRPAARRTVAERLCHLHPGSLA
jgi:hypothetical protein